jgi:hypothetical protein
MREVEPGEWRIRLDGLFGALQVGKRRGKGRHPIEVEDLFIAGRFCAGKERAATHSPTWRKG